MPEQGINLMTVVVGTILLLAVITGLIFFGVIGPIDSTKLGRNMEFACAQYQGEIGCARDECTAAYDSVACRDLLAVTKYTVKTKTFSVWETCNSIGIKDAAEGPRDCQIRCCGITDGGKGGVCRTKDPVCDVGLTCVSGKCKAA